MSTDANETSEQPFVIAWFQRDASFWTRPNTSGVKKLHIKRNGSPVSLCGGILLCEYPWPNSPQSMKCKRCLRASR